MLVAVTGATGHIGANLVRALLERGDRVRALMHDEVRAVDGLPIERISGDVRDRASLDAAFAGCERVYHLAARISIGMGDAAECEAVNVGGVRNVVAACLAAGVKRLVHFSSIHAFATLPREGVVDEARPLGDESPLPYDRSKARGQKEVLAGIARGLDAVIVNPTGVIGPLDFAPSRMGSVLLDLWRRRLPGLVEGGFDWVDVRDVVAGALAAADRAPAGAGYVLSGHHASVVEIAATVEALTGVRRPRLVSPMWLAQVGAPFVAGWAMVTRGSPRFTPASLHALRNHQRVSHDKATRELGYAPRPLRQTIADTLGWLKEAHACQVQP